jgi:Adenylate and Guanylate cyclase catalytic domain
VFTLLESIFQSFDAIAKKYGVFKVETIGDCYVGKSDPRQRFDWLITCLTIAAVAACGVPKANAQHAVVMCRFARNIMVKFRWVCRSLELTLGPDTGGKALSASTNCHRLDCAIDVSCTCC